MWPGSELREENTVFVLRPSPWLSLDAWVGAMVACFLINALGLQALMLIEILLNLTLPLHTVFLGSAFPFLFAFWRTLELRCTVYRITDQRIILRQGVFSTVHLEVDLLRIRHYEVHEPFYLRMMGLGNLVLLSAERTVPEMKIIAQSNVHVLRDHIRRLVQQRQADFGYREYEVTA